MDEALKALETLTKQLDEFKAKQEKSVGTKADKEQIDTIAKQIETLNGKIETMEAAKVSEALASIKKQLEEVAEDVNKVKDGNLRFGSANKTIGQMIVEKMKEMGVSSKLPKGERKSFELDIPVVNKIAGTFTTANVTGSVSNAIPFSLSEDEAGLTRIVRRRPWIMDIANTSSTSKMYVQWAEQENQDGDAGETTQGSTKNQIDFDWVEKSKKVEKVTAFIKTSKEALDDLDSLANEIDMELREEIMLAVDAALLSGDGTTPSLAGILSMDTAYDAGSFAGTVIDPNKADVLRTAIAQVVANQFYPNYALCHPDDIAAMDLEKASDGHYALAPFRSADGTVISGVKVLANTGQTVDKFTVGDFTKLNVKVRQGLTVDMGYDGNDFTKNLVTILGEIRLVSYIKSNHAGAFVSGDFSEAITALDAGS